MPKNLSAVLKGSLVGILLMFAAVITAAAVSVLTPLKESTIIFLLPFIRCGCIFIGAFYASVLNGHQGLWQGLGVSVVFLVIFFIYTALLGLENAVFWHLAISIILAGGFGGIVGILLSQRGGSFGM